MNVSRSALCAIERDLGWFVDPNNWQFTFHLRNATFGIRVRVCVIIWILLFI